MQETTTDTSMDRLVRQIAQIGEVDLGEVARAARELAGTDAGYRSQYVGFNDGHWHSAVLVNPSGRHDDHLISDGTGRPTELAAHLPGAMQIINDLAARFGLNVCWARLALMESGARVWEHRDFLELQQQDKVRLHVPLITNDRATLHFAEGAVHLAPGFVWHLATAHSPWRQQRRPGPGASDHRLRRCRGVSRPRRPAAARPLAGDAVPGARRRVAGGHRGPLPQDRGGGGCGRSGAGRPVAVRQLGSAAPHHVRAAGAVFDALGQQDKAEHWRTEEKDKLYERVY